MFTHAAKTHLYANTMRKSILHLMLRLIHGHEGNKILHNKISNEICKFVVNITNVLYLAELVAC